jgi:glutathione S-transferase
VLTLFHAPRSRSFRMLWLLEELAAPFEVKIVGIRRGDGSGASDPANPHPHGKVPALKDDGTLIFETPAIALYLTDKFPAAGLGPKIGDAERGAYLTWLSYYTGVIEPSLTAKFLKIQHIYGTFGWAPFDDVIAYLTRELSGRSYLLGDRFSAADIVIGGSLPLLMGRGIVPEAEVFKAYTARVTARPAFARAQAKDNGYGGPH